MASRIQHPEYVSWNMESVSKGSHERNLITAGSLQNHFHIVPGKFPACWDPSDRPLDQYAWDNSDRLNFNTVFVLVFD